MVAEITLVRYVESQPGSGAERFQGFAVDEEVGTETKKIALTATALGKYPFYCSNKLLFFASHRERGMEGILEVVQ